MNFFFKKKKETANQNTIVFQDSTDIPIPANYDEHAVEGMLHFSSGITSQISEDTSGIDDHLFRMLTTEDVRATHTG